MVFCSNTDQYELSVLIYGTHTYTHKHTHTHTHTHTQMCFSEHKRTKPVITKPVIIRKKHTHTAKCASQNTNI